MYKKLDIFLTLALTAFLTVGMLWPFEASPHAPKGGDKLVHFIAFAALVVPFAYTGRFGLVQLLTGASAFGGIIEFIQPTYNRSADVNNRVADTLGVLTGLGFGVIYRRRRQYRT